MEMKLMSYDQITAILTSQIYTDGNGRILLFTNRKFYAYLPPTIKIESFVKIKDLDINAIFNANENSIQPYNVNKSGDDFIFKTQKNKFHPLVNDFILSVEDNDAKGLHYTVSLLSLEDGTELFRFETLRG